MGASTQNNVSLTLKPYMVCTTGLGGGRGDRSTSMITTLHCVQREHSPLNSTHDKGEVLCSKMGFKCASGSHGVIQNSKNKGSQLEVGSAHGTQRGQVKGLCFVLALGHPLKHPRCHGHQCGEGFRWKGGSLGRRLFQTCIAVPNNPSYTRCKTFLCQKYRPKES